MQNHLKRNAWLPTSLEEIKERSWNELDVILFTGDAYIDHPSFGAAVIGRVIEALGFKVAIVPQPNWRDDLRDFTKLGKPRLFFGVTSGSMDSMLNNYTASQRKRSQDAYSPGGKIGFRPDYAVSVYSQILKSLFPEVPVIIGGIESSLRRFGHYDYWSDSYKLPILIESNADILVYGMGELPIKHLLSLFSSHLYPSKIHEVKQIAYLVNNKNDIPETTLFPTRWLASWEECRNNKKISAQTFRIIERESDSMYAARLIQPAAGKWVVVNPPFPPMNEEETDFAFDLPYTRLPHPRYKGRGDIPAFEMIKHSVTLHRGCFGGCAFCTISAHQGKFINSRSEKSILKELEIIASSSDFKGHITDLGGPTANMWKMKGVDNEQCSKCKKPSCLFPKICHNLYFDHKPLLQLYQKALQVNGIKKISIGSGIRYDMLVGQSPEITKKYSLYEYARQVIVHHVSGRLKVAPEHTEDDILKIMRKPSYSLFVEFQKWFNVENQRHNLRQQLIPYFISGHPGSKPEHMARLAIKTRLQGFKLEQVQDFTPTPMTLATEIFWSGYNPESISPVFTARTLSQKQAQQCFFFWYKPEFLPKIRKVLQDCGKPELYEQIVGKTNKKRKN